MGLFRYYWIVAKFLLTVVATIVLLLHLRPISIMADAVSGDVVPDLKIRGLRVQLLADAGAALLMLLVTTTISVYKPWGMTGYGKRKLNEQGKKHRPVSQPCGDTGYFMFCWHLLRWQFLCLSFYTWQVEVSAPISPSCAAHRAFSILFSDAKKIFGLNNINRNIAIEWD